ncbi:unnamed protein product [Sphagnum balticum]
MRAEQRSKLQACLQRSGTLSHRRRDGSNAAAALKILRAKKRRANEEDEQGKRGVDGARGRPGPTTARALRARTKARAPGRAGPGRDPTSMEVSSKRFARPADPVGCDRQGKFLGVRNINFFHTGIVF